MDTKLQSVPDITHEPAFFWPTVGRPGMVPLWALMPTPNQPRKHFDPIELFALAETMRGGRQREIITVRALTASELKMHAPARYLIKSGERRWRSAHIAELPAVEIRVKEYENEAEEALDAFMLNENRVGLSDIENARAIADLARLHGWETQAEIGKGIGKDQVWVSQHLALLKLSAKAQEKMNPGKKDQVPYTRQVGVFLSRLSPETQDDFVTRMPEHCQTAGQQINWMTAELKEKGVVLETRTRTPSKLRERLGNMLNHVQTHCDNFLDADDFTRLFDLATPQQKEILLHRLKRTEGQFAALGVRIRQLADPSSRAAIQTPRSVQDVKSAAAEFMARRSAQTLEKPVPQAAPKPAPDIAVHRHEPRPQLPQKQQQSVRVAAPPPAAPPQKTAPLCTPGEAKLRKWKMNGITVSCLNESTGRCGIIVLSPYQYADMWKKRKLEFQIKREQKPEWLPTLEEAIEASQVR